MGRQAGVTEGQLIGLPDFENSCQFSKTEKAVLRYAVAMTQTPVDLPDEMLNALRAFLDERQIVELTSAIAWENYRARFNHALGIESEGFYHGQLCLLPQPTPAARP